MFDLLKKAGFQPDHPAVVALSVSQSSEVPADIRARRGRFGAVLELTAAIAEFAAPITAQELKNWFLLIVPHVKTGNMSPDEIVARVESVAFAFTGKPRFLFDVDLQRRVLLACEWLPVPAEIYKLIEDQDRQYAVVRAALNGMLGRPHFEALPTRADLGAAPEANIVPIRIAGG